MDKNPAIKPFFENVAIFPKTKFLTEVKEIRNHIPDLSDERLQNATNISQQYQFRVPEFYASKVLQGHSGDPLIDIVLPSLEEQEDGDELWDSTPSPYKVSDSPFWVQKYEHQGLIRTTTFCSGLCRFCYLKKKNAKAAIMSVKDVEELFDDLERRGNNLREIILSGGDPLNAPVETLKAIGLRMGRLRLAFGRNTPHITIHTREPVWDPIRLLSKQSLWIALGIIKPKTFMINVLHPREVTDEFLDVCSKLAEVGGSKARSALLCQHPLFRGVNDSVEVLEELYQKLFAASTPILPYYIVHPFYNGTLPKHRLSLEESQAIFQQLVRRPGCLTPSLVVPTPWGKCVVGPYEKLTKVGGAYQLTTKDGKRVKVY